MSGNIMYHVRTRCSMKRIPTNKVWDVTPPLDWNWSEQDRRVWNFMKDLNSWGGVIDMEDRRRYVIVRFNKIHPAQSIVIFEDDFKSTKEIQDSLITKQIQSILAII